MMIVALCLGLLSCRQTAPRQDVLEVIFPTGTEGFVEVTFGAEGERCDTLPIVDGRLLMEKDSLPVTVTLKYLKERDADDKVWLAVQGAHARWGSIPLGYGRTEVTFDSLTPQVSVGRIADEYGDFEANDVFFNAPQHFRSQDFLKAHSESVQALHLLSKSWDADTLQMALDCFSPSLRNSDKGQELQQLILARKERGGVAKRWMNCRNAHGQTSPRSLMAAQKDDHVPLSSIMASFLSSTFSTDTGTRFTVRWNVVAENPWMMRKKGSKNC